MREEKTVEPQTANEASGTKSSGNEMVSRVIESYHKERLQREFELLAEEADWVDG